MRFHSGAVACVLFSLGTAPSTTLGFHATSGDRILWRQNRKIPTNKDVSPLFSYYVAPNEDDEELINSILGPMGQKRNSKRGRSILILSDTTGVTAKSAVEKSLSQVLSLSSLGPGLFSLLRFESNSLRNVFSITPRFNGCDERFLSVEDEDDDPCELTQKNLYPFLRKTEDIKPILEKATERNLKTLIVFTFADPLMRKAVIEMCEELDLQYVDLLGGMFDMMTDFFGREPIGMAGPGTRRPGRRELTELYYSQVDAIEFTLKADDGMAPWLLPEADVVLVGVSRTGKTPLSVFLSQSQAFKVANVPLVYELDPPKQLYEVDPQRVFCLTLNPIDLQRIRESRLERELQRIPDQQSTYAEWDYLKKDLAKARRLADENGFTEIDVTGQSVEETASRISSLLNERFPTIGWANPST